MQLQCGVEITQTFGLPHSSMSRYDGMEKRDILTCDFSGRYKARARNPPQNKKSGTTI